MEVPPDLAPNLRAMSIMSDTDDEDDRRSTTLISETDSRGDDNDIDEIVALTEQEVAEFRAQQRIFESLRAEGYRRADRAKSLTDGWVKPNMRFECVDETFVRVRQIWIKDSHVRLFGHRMLRNGDVEAKMSATAYQLCSYLPRKENELCVVMKVSKGDSRLLTSDAGIEEITLEEITSEANIVFTNRDRRGLVRGTFFCRRKFVREIELKVNDGSPARRGSTNGTANVKSTTYRIELLREEETDADMGISDVLKSRIFRAGSNSRSPGSSPASNSPKSTTSSISSKSSPTGSKRKFEQVIDLTESDVVDLTGDTNDSPTSQASAAPVRYTFGDAFAGAGCVSLGAHRAGAKTKWAVDNAKAPCHTLAYNFKQMKKVHHKDIFLFIEEAKRLPERRFKREIGVDILHLSTPCQAFSSVNPGTNEEKDAVNTALSYCVQEMIQLIRPRRVTLEQTKGIVDKYEGQHLRAVVLQLTSENYNVAWKVENTLEHGVPQSRKRIIILASCPGEKLPEYPTPTHGTAPGLLPPVTIDESLANIDPETTDHEVALERQKHAIKPYRGRPVDGNKPLRRILLTNGSQDLHPDGDRRFTIRELMRFQGLPDWFHLQGNGYGARCTMVGNAVPVDFYEAIAKELIKSLKEHDKDDKEYDEIQFT